MGLLADIILNMLTGGGPKEVRPQGPGLNVGEVKVRKSVGLPTTARRTQYSTSSGPGSGPKQIPKSFAGVKASAKAKVKVHDKTNHDFKWSKVDALSEWGKEFDEKDSYLNLLKTGIQEEPGNIKKAYNDLNNSMKGWTPGDAIVDYVKGVHETVNKPWLSYDKQNGFDADWDAVGEKASMSLAAIPAGKAKAGMTLMGKGVDGPAPRVAKAWHEAGTVAPESHQIGRGAYQMGPTRDPITGVPTRFGGRVVDPRRHQPATYSTANDQLMNVIHQLRMF